MNKTGEELFKEFGYELLWKKSKITVIIDGKEHVICSKNKLVNDPNYDGYNHEITKAFWKAVQSGLLKYNGKKTRIKKKER